MKVKKYYISIIKAIDTLRNKTMKACKNYSCITNAWFYERNCKGSIEFMKDCDNYIEKIIPCANTKCDFYTKSFKHKCNMYLCIDRMRGCRNYIPVKMTKRGNKT